MALALAAGCLATGLLAARPAYGQQLQSMGPVGFSPLALPSPATPEAGPPPLPGRKAPLAWHERGVAEPLRPTTLQGLTLLELKRYPQARHHFEELLQANPTNAVFYFLRGRALLGMNHRQLAQDDFERALALDGENPGFYLFLGQWAYQQRDDATAEHQLSIAARLAPQDGEPRYLLALLHARNNRNLQALVFFNQAAALKPNFAPLYLNRGFIYARLEKYPQALADIEKAMALDPNPGGAQGAAQLAYNQGLIYAYVGQYGVALASLDRAINLGYRHPAAYYNRGNVRRMLNQPQEALEDYQRAVELEPGYVQAHHNRAFVLMEQNRQREALLAYGQTLELAPQMAQAWLNRGWLYYQRQETGPAGRDFDQALALEPTNRLALYNRATVYFYAKRLPQACGLWAKGCGLQDAASCAKEKSFCQSGPLPPPATGPEVDETLPPVWPTQKQPPRQAK